MIKLSKCYVGEEELCGVKEVLDSGYLGMGTQTFAFEKELKDYLSTNKEVICVNSGTAALHLALHSLGIGPGNEVLVPSLTFAASFQAISATGATPIACDIKPDTLSIDLQSAKQYVTEKTRAIMPVHFASHVETPHEIYAFAEQYKLRIVEDAAHAFGTTVNNKLVGAEGDVICFSFDGIKNITCGEGGAIVTNDQALIERARDGRLLAINKDWIKRKEGVRSWEFDIEQQGYRYHMSDIMAAIGRSQLRKVSYFKERRQCLVQNYLNALVDIPHLRLLKLDYPHIMPHIFTVRITDNKRDGLREYLQQNAIETGIHYKPNHLLTFYKTAYALENAEAAYQEILSLPLHVGLDIETQRQVIKLITEYLT